MAKNNSGNGRSTFSVIGSDIVITGDIAASADLHIDGKVEGDIACSSLVQGETSVIHGNVKADRARLSGTVNGSIAAKELVVLQTARITGDVQYDALTIEQGAQVEGRFAPKMDKPAAKQAQQVGANDEPKLAVAR
ncbi:polymer-forming cytoskeletal protein [Altererythrobacter aurantiacus]|uniref:Polymer-forming cytoskeletal protein n=1 Tax=Parapontixanthobacter aurantiacus TaxID=1463599 RepID=A0A844ZIQ9_9SPHN|nr:polymer-forming cytoskeletal protein [Parapontixanthobacter aurantiacus]MXO86807.1 polymer-forming cytoskeletal protein [Parapontixanthobacter aurantiacus]